MPGTTQLHPNYIPDVPRLVPRPFPFFTRKNPLLFATVNCQKSHDLTIEYILFFHSPHNIVTVQHSKNVSMVLMNHNEEVSADNMMN